MKDYFILIFFIKLCCINDDLPFLKYSYGFVSKDALKSYFREENFKTPPLSKLDEMAEALGKPTYELIKEDKSDEKTDT